MIGEENKKKPKEKLSVEQNLDFQDFLKKLQQLADDTRQEVSVEAKTDELTALLSKEKAEGKVFVGIRPSTGLTTIKQQSFLSVTNVMGVLALTGTLILHFLLARQKEKFLQEEENNKKECASFFIRTHIIRRALELYAEVVATEHTAELNKEFNLNGELKQFMVGRIVCILDERTHYVQLEMFPDRSFNYEAHIQIHMLTPFIYLNDFKKPFWRKKPSLKSTTGFFQKYFIKNYRTKNKLINIFLKLIKRQKKF